MSLSHLKMRHLMLIDFLIAHGTIHRAAKLLSITQPAATAMLNDLERLLGLALFVRSRRGVLPTAAARSLHDKVRLLLNEFGELTTTVQRISEGREPVLRVGVVPQAFVVHMPQAIERFRAGGGCALRAEEGTTQQLLERLFEGNLDCFIGRLPIDGLPEGRRPEDLSVSPLYHDEVCVVARPGHAILAAKRLKFSQLTGEQWVLQRRDSSVRRAFAEAFMRAGMLPPEPAVETATYNQNLAVVAHSNLLSVVPRSAAEQHQALGLITILKFSLGVQPMQVNILMRASSCDNVMLARFRDALIASVAAALPKARASSRRHTRTSAAATRSLPRGVPPDNRRRARVRA